MYDKCIGAGLLPGSKHAEHAQNRQSVYLYHVYLHCIMQLCSTAGLYVLVSKGKATLSDLQLRKSSGCHAWLN